MECFEVQYTKQVKQKAKTWEDGYMTFDKSCNKFIVYLDSTRFRTVDQVFKAIPSIYLEADYEIQFPRHLV